jgi:osmotically-inducible protein OsmY
MIRTDEQIKTDIVNTMRWDTSVDASDVKVEVDDSVVTLSGTAPTYGASSAAFYDAYFTRGVTRVESQLKVRLAPTQEVPTEGQIKDMVQNVLRWSADIDASGIEITVEGGEVTLKGNVPLYTQRAQAEQQVSGIHGVMGIKNELVVVPTQQIGDQLVAEDLTAALERSFILDPTKVQVKVANGVVTLVGEVATSFASWRAEKMAHATLGVRDVRNYLKVKYV